MATTRPPSASHDARDDSVHGDPWRAFAYLVSGVLLYGGLGWLVDRWLGTSWVVGLGIVVGAGLGLYMAIARFRHDEHHDARRGGPRQDGSGEA